MDSEAQRRITVSFTTHQMQLLDRLMEQQGRWESLDELIVEAVHDFGDRHAGEDEEPDDD